MTNTTLVAKYVKLGLVSAGAFLAIVSAPAISAQGLSDQEIYERAQKLDLPDYIGGSLKGILNQNSDVTYPTDKAGATQSETPQATQRLTDQEIYERAQKLDLPEHINGSLKGILNQNLSVTYPKDKAGITQPVAYQAAQPLTDQEIYERAQKLDLPDYIGGSLKGILNQNSDVTYPTDKAGATQSETPQATQRLTDQEIYERAQKLDLPDYIGGSLKGILNQNSSVTYPTDY
ncbi:hypothetical protein ML603_08695 [Streptococcus dysgalactiae subsp. equisimilis]|uniref:hypothetical protein n=1 Tax=Streptococcus dysgalactiae TaxID=1334 RepID=UPI0018676D46|nr:hypothetical protein [Streptococcus dysgalactiae]MCL6222323.1 hypothetical protein [Streptococcus dysgalactiae subsp. equisimilis]MEC4577760.1 hypothetical protein [Streptococcus dysgalactiae]UMY67949.1 hypothetical protein ML603_08695 [Streptococcus dysgalactiae subsp. equisimilis]